MTDGAEPPREGMKILVISLAGIGDTILATPLIHELRVNFPHARIDALVLWAGSKAILEVNPHLNAVHQRNLMREGKLQSFGFLRHLRSQDYDFSINTHPQSRIHYRITARVVGARRRLSHVYECSGLLDRLLINQTLPQDYTRHTVDLNLDFLRLLGGNPILPHHELEVFLSPYEYSWAGEFVARQGLAERRRLGVHIGSGGTKNLALKRWPLDHYVALLKRLRRDKPELAVLLFGGPEEEEMHRRVMAEVGSPLVLQAKTGNLRQTGALMRECHAFLSVDTALMHIAAAVRARNQIVIEAPTLNKTNEPYANPYTLVRNPAIAGRNLEFYRYDGRGIRGSEEELVKCMSSVTVDAVYEAVDRALPGR